ncbi:hypothetical protein [Rhus yellows phytoplasma]|uniref:Uncharacterized protein n=1 Tax=Rhus yellows phytoplasma TaxID=1225349 RepID=A0ABQ5PT10_9MOLU|nr:hypothetical protein RHYP_5090 [Rhus yellows phytoplasma]
MIQLVFIYLCVSPAYFSSSSHQDSNEISGLTKKILNLLPDNNLLGEYLTSTINPL